MNKIDLLQSDNTDDDDDGKKEKNSSVVNQIKAVIYKLNPQAKIIIPNKPYFQEFDAMNTIINTQLFDMDEAQKSAGWIAELDKPYHTPETEEYGVKSFV